MRMIREGKLSGKCVIFAGPLGTVDRAVIIATEEYDSESIRDILQLRCEEEEVKMEKDAIEKLTQIGSKSSLRYSVQLPSLVAQNAKTMKHESHS